MKTSAIVLALALALVANASALTLVQDGKPVSMIVIGDGPTPSQEVAAEELQYHLRKMTGATVPIVTERELGDRQGALILVGQSELLTALDIDTSKLAPETLIVKTVGDILVLAGEDGGKNTSSEPYDSLNVRTGTLYAVYDFLQDQLGCRWLWPGESGEAIPKRATVDVGDLDIQETPKVFMRKFRRGLRPETAQRVEEYCPRYMTHSRNVALSDMIEEEGRWLKRMKMGGARKLSYGHAFTKWLGRYGRQHPEVFALQEDGSRGKARPNYPDEFVKLCPSSPRLIELILNEYKRGGSGRYLNACENDGKLGYCHCATCRSWDYVPDEAGREALKARGWDDALIDDRFGPHELDGMPRSLSNRYYRFYNDLAKAIKKINPDATVITYGYARHRYAPVGLQLDPSIMVGLIGFNTYPMDERTRWQERENFLAWRQCGIQKLFFRPNSFYFSPALGIPWSAAHQMGEDLKLLLDNGVVYTDFDTLNGYWSTAAPTYYITARMLWDADADVDQLLSEFYGGFGPSAKAVGNYFGFWEKTFEDMYTRPDLQERMNEVEPYEDLGRMGRRRVISTLLVQEDFDKARGMLDEARNAAGDDSDLLRKIEVLELGLRHGELMWKSSKQHTWRIAVDDVRYADRWPIVKEVFAVRDRLAALHAHNIFWMGAFEVELHDVYGTRVYHDFAGRPWEPVMTPAEGKWVLVPDPDDKGEAEVWPGKVLERPAEFDVEYPRYDHYFYQPWSESRGAKNWIEVTHHPQIRHGWYQAVFALTAEDMAAGNVLYLPSVLGAAKVWVDDRLVREVTAAEAKGGNVPVIVPMNETGIEPGKRFRLTVKVSNARPGGLIGPPYVARPAKAK